MGWAVVLWCVAAACLGAAALFGIIAATGLSIDRHMDNNGITTTATVTDVDDTYVTVEFTTEDNESAVAEFVWWPDVFPAVNDEIEITYDPDDPSYATQAGSKEDQILGTVLAVATVASLAAAAGAGVGAMFVHRARRKAAQSSGSYYY